MRTVLVAVVVVAMLAICNTAAEEEPFENPRVCRIPTSIEADPEYDTVAIVTFRQIPEYRKPTTVDIDYFARQDDAKGIIFRGHNYAEHSFLWDTHEINVDGPVKKGDTVRVSFTLTPQRLGSVCFRVSPTYREVAEAGKKQQSPKVEVAFALDENGEVLSEEVYRVIYGPTRDIAKDSLVFMQLCADRYAPKKDMCLRLTITPNFAPGMDSKIRYEFVSFREFPEGISYTFRYDDRLDIDWPDTNDWAVVHTGDTLVIEATARAVMPGLTHIVLWVGGYYRGDDDPGTDTTHHLKRYSSGISASVAIGESLEYLAVVQGRQLSPPGNTANSDAHRFDAIAKLAAAYPQDQVKRHRIYSKRWLAFERD